MNLRIVWHTASQKLLQQPDYSHVATQRQIEIIIEQSTVPVVADAVSE